MSRLQSQGTSGGTLRAPKLLGAIAAPFSSQRTSRGALGSAFRLLMIVTAFLLSMALLSEAQSQRCNGFAALCTKRLSDVAFAVTHNAYAVGQSIAANQNLPISIQLKDGIRGFKLTVMRNPKGADPQEIHLCHGQCGDNTIFSDGGPLVATLREFRDFLVANPNEVIVIFIENQRSILADDIMADFESSGLADLSYAHPDDETAWPTLRSLISARKRSIVFVDRVVIEGSNIVSDSVGYFMAELGYVASNYWLQTVETAFTCRQHQPYDGNSGDLILRQLFHLNHMLYNNVSATVQVPARNKVEGTNGIDSIQDHVNSCFTEFGRGAVNFVSVDYYEIVDYSVLRIVDALNGVERETYGTPVTTTARSTSATRSRSATRTAETVPQGTIATLTRNPPNTSSGSAVAPRLLLAFVASFLVFLSI